MRISTLSIRTPEGIVFSQILAGPVTRFLAWFLDVLCIGFLVSCLNIAVTLLNLVSTDLAIAIVIIGFFVISTGYRICFEWFWRGQTPGKRVFQLRVMDAEGLKLKFSQVILRNLLRAVDALPFAYFLGGVTCWVNSKGQRLGDIAASTIVIRVPRVAEPDIDPLIGGKYNSLRQYPHLAARLRQRISPAEAAIAVQALIRRDDFDAAARVELFEDLAGRFRRMVEFPSEATDGVAAEQYVRNVVDILYRPDKSVRPSPAQSSGLPRQEQSISNVE